MSTNNIMHFGDSVESSLTDFGMVCQREKSNQHHFIYKVENGYEEGFISEYDLQELMNGEAGYDKSDIHQFINTVKVSTEDFMQLPILERVYKLSEHFGVENILGKSIAPLTLDDALLILGKE